MIERETYTDRAESAGEAKFEEYINDFTSGDREIDQLTSENLGPFFEPVRDHFIHLIPSRYRDNLWPPELVEEMWSPALPVDYDEAEKQARARKLALWCYGLRWKAEQALATQYLPENLTHKNELAPEVSLVPGEEVIAPRVEAVGVNQTGAKEKQAEEKIIPTHELPLNNEIARPATQEAFGDSNGSYESVMAHLKNRDLINAELVWTGGTTQAVFIGDILGDRTPEGLAIYDFLYKLKQQAQAEGGDVNWLAGNHENMSNAVLAGFTTEFGCPVDEDMKGRLRHYTGNLEWGQYLPPTELTGFFKSLESQSQMIHETLTQQVLKKKKVLSVLEHQPDAKPEVVQSYRQSIVTLETELVLFNRIVVNGSPASKADYLKLLPLIQYMPEEVSIKLAERILDHRAEILANVREERPELIETIVAQKIAHMQDDVLYVHSNFTAAMARLILERVEEGESLSSTVAKLNHTYQESLRQYLQPTDNSLSPRSSTEEQDFNTIRDTFLSTSRASRVNYTEDPGLTAEDKYTITQTLRSLGVSVIIHGHNDEQGQILGDPDLPIVSIDNSTFKSEGALAQTPTSHAVVDTNGMVRLHNMK